MTDHQRARRARKSKEFFAKLALRAVEAGDKLEAMRLATAAQRKLTTQKLAATTARLCATVETARALRAA